jgi:uncharacterized protein (DUF3084 family)
MASNETQMLLSKIHERIHEKDQVIEEQMTQIADLEDKIEALEAELKELRTIKQDYEKLKKELDSMLGD